jgi:putative endonuclease
MEIFGVCCQRFPAGYPFSMDWMLSLEFRVHAALRRWADRRLPQAAHLLTGERGEDAAFFYLRDCGYTVVARRWRSERLSGDLDLVAWDGDTLVVVEVKTRTARDFSPAEASVEGYKKVTLRRMARAYVQQIPEAWRASVPVRFDVLAVYLLASGVEFEHFRAAFAGEEPLPGRG